MIQAVRELIEQRLATLDNDIETETYINERADLRRELELGATGDFPLGKLNADDEGALQIAIGRDEKTNVVLNFGKPIAWVAMPPQDAVNFALTVLGHAGAKIQVNIDDAIISRAREFIGRSPLYENPIFTEPWIRNLLQFALNGAKS